MAVRFNSDADWISRSVNIGGAGHVNFALGGWFYLEAYNDSSGILAAGHSGNGRTLGLSCDNNFPTPRVCLGDSQTGFSSGNFSSQPPLNTWFYAEVSSPNVTGGTVTARWAALGSSTVATITRTNGVEASVQAEVVNVNRFAVGDANGFEGGMRAAYVRGYSSPTANDAAFLANMADTSGAGTLFFWPLADNTDTGDISGNGRTATFNGSLTTESSPTLGGGAAALEAAAAAVASVTAALTTAIRFAATPAAQASVSAGLTTAIRAAASMSAVAVMTATLSTAIRPAAAMAATATATGNLSTSIRLAATPSATATQTGNLSTQIRFAAAPAAVAAISANLTTAVRMQAQAAAVATMTAALDGAAAALQASPAAVASLTANLSTAIRPAAALVSQATMTASLAGTAADLQAGMAGQAQLAGALTTAIPLAAAPQAVASGSGALTTSIRMQVVMAGVVTMTASLDAVPIYTSSPGFVVSRQKARPYTVTRIRARQFTVRTR